MVGILGDMDDPETHFGLSLKVSRTAHPGEKNGTPVVILKTPILQQQT